MRTTFQTFLSNLPVGYSGFPLLAPSLCREACITEGVWSHSSVWESLSFPEAQGRTVLVDEVSTDFEDFQHKNRRWNGRCFHPGPMWLATARSPSPIRRTVQRLVSLFRWGDGPVACLFRRSLRFQEVAVKNTDSRARPGKFLNLSISIS